MKYYLRIIIFSTTLIWSNSFLGQITINTNVSAQELVDNLVGQGITSSNVSITAFPQAIGTFNAVNSNIGISSGIILTTGRAPTTVNLFSVNQGCPLVAGISNPMNSGAIASTNHNFFEINVPELQTLFPQNQQFFDRAILSFQFVPLSTPVTFRYVFASEEWPQWVNSQFNDVFGFFLSGPGITGEQNIAVLPGTNTPITVSTMPVIENNGNTCAYNAFTPVFTATANVIPCSTYTIKLIIADVGDSSYDSAVFLEENSFGSAPFTSNVSSLAGDNVTYEGCAPATVTFTRPVATNEPLTINLTVGGTATMGVDYVNIPTSVTIPAGQTSVSITIQGIEDNIPEPAETITITYNLGCNQTETITIFLMDKPPVEVTVNEPPSICEGVGPVTLSASGSGGVPPLNYSWSNNAGNTSNISVNPSTTTTYTVTVTDYCGTTATQSVTVNVSSIPAAPIISSNSPLCDGATLTLSANNVNNGNFNWTGPNGFNSNSQNPTISNVTQANAGEYSVTVTVNGCTSEPANINAVVYPLPAPPIASSNSPVCGSNTLILNASNVPGGTFSWTGPNGFTSNLQNPTVGNMSTDLIGDYSVTVTVNGCTSQPSVTTATLASTAAPVITYNAPVCQGQTLTLSAPDSPNTTYAWTGPNGFTSTAQNPSINNVSLAAIGQYSLVMNISGCITDPGFVDVIITPTPEAPVVNNINPICEGQTINLTTNTVVGATYNWSGPNGFSSSLQNPVINNAPLGASGNYSLTITVNGCTSAPTNTSVLINPIPQAPTLFSNSPICEGIALDLTMQNVAGATYSWSGPNSFASDLQSPTIINATPLASGNYSATVTVNGCTSPASTINVVVHPIPEAPSISSNGPVCLGSTLNLFTPSQPAGVVTYSWNGPAGFASTLQNPTISNVSENNEGTYSLSITVNGCQSPVSTHQVDVIDMPPLDAGANVSFCSGESVQLGQEGFPNITYSWSPSNGLNNANVANPILTLTNNGSQPQNYTYTVTSSVNGCLLTDQVQVTVLPEPVVSFAVPPSQCFQGNNFSFVANGTFSNNAQFNWSFGPFANISESNLRNPSGISFSNTGTHPVSVQVTDNGCTSQPFTANVTVHAMPVSNFVSDVQSGCMPFKVNFINLSESTSGTLNYLWHFGNENNSQATNPVHIYSNPGRYTVRLTVTNSHGCSDTYTINDYIEVFPKAKADFKSTPWELEIINPEIELTSFSSNATNGFYVIGDNELIIEGFNGKHTFTKEGVYPIMHVAINDFGCSDTIVKNVIVRTGLRVYFPSTFTPNSDGLNDYFKPLGEGITNYEIQIYNRWGELLYTSYDMENGWDGTTRLSNNILPSDIYFYRSYVTDELGKIHEYKGWVMLLR